MLNKHRVMSSFNHVKSEYGLEHRNLVLQEAINEFDIYQKSMPNTDIVYINGSKDGILGTIQDITDLELRTDTKYMLTSLKNKVYVGDLVKWRGKPYMCIYDKVKTTGTCNKVKIQPCSTFINFIALDKDNKHIITKQPVIANVYYTDIREDKTPVPWNSDLYGISIPYNNYTKQLRKQDRIFMYTKDNTWEIVGVDYTNIDYTTDRGFYRFMLRSRDVNKTLDNQEKMICNYYKIFPKEDNTPVVPVAKVKLSTSKSKLKVRNTYHISSTGDNGSYGYIFNGKNLDCKIDTSNYDTGFDLTTGGKFGTICIQALFKETNEVCGSIILRIGQ